MQDNNFFGSTQKGASQFWKGLQKVKHLFQWGAEYKVVIRSDFGMTHGFAVCP
jgi:hypothetical protein